MATPGLGLDAAAQKSEELAALKLQTEQRLIGGANWFFWIAGLSLVNAALSLGGSQTRFIVGLGITDVVNYIGTQAGSVGSVAALVITAFVAGLFVLFGLMARKRHKWAFVVGMMLYALDGLLFLLAQEWLSIGFHVFALFGLYKGMAALGELRVLEQPVVNVGPAPIG